MSLFQNDDPENHGLIAFLSGALSRLAIGGSLAAALFFATEALSEPLPAHPTPAKTVCGLNEADAADIMAVLMNEVSQPPGAKVASFVRTYDALCRSARFGPCPHNREEWEALHPTQ